ncbi:hypothetical protein F511_24312 [Dorcoceras hygrometricum]|uniref:Uncharacterized protein n=1 Tax=Dorcoceras hygrometricum TaxID=472368 RepID=A0A2Z7CBV3_9LAMI|nr:hypothetical protein F511_24312 [Dorcoceras hygrometricum]
MMNSRRIFPADGSQYKDSAVGLVFMESASGLAMETSKVESVVRNQAEAKLNQLEHNSADALCDEESDVVQEVLSSRKLLFTSRCYLEIAIAKRCRLHKLIRQRFALALKIQQLMSNVEQEADNSKRNSEESDVVLKNQQMLDNQTQATAHPVVSYNEPAVAMQDEEFSRKINPVEGYSALHIQSPKNSAEAQSSSRHESAAKQLTIYESWMSTAERNSNGENDKTQSTLKMERING